MYYIWLIILCSDQLCSLLSGACICCIAPKIPHWRMQQGDARRRASAASLHKKLGKNNFIFDIGFATIQPELIQWNGLSHQQGIQSAGKREREMLYVFALSTLLDTLKHGRSQLNCSICWISTTLPGAAQYQIENVKIWESERSQVWCSKPNWADVLVTPTDLLELK